ncbi:Hypothetical protein HVR_LOCUS382 [uncultured virus]|nr:Hypothetical protein HVR_LOCUS382 [uncultured virus]
MIYYHIIAGCQNLGTPTPEEGSTVLAEILKTIDNINELETELENRFYTQNFLDFSEDPSFFSNENSKRRNRYVKECMEKIKSSSDELINCSHLSYNTECCHMYVYVTDSKEVYLTRREMKMIFPHDD